MAFFAYNLVVAVVVESYIHTSNLVQVWVGLSLEYPSSSRQPHHSPCPDFSYTCSPMPLVHTCHLRMGYPQRGELDDFEEQLEPSLAKHSQVGPPFLTRLPPTHGIGQICMDLTLTARTRERNTNPLRSQSRRRTNSALPNRNHDSDSDLNQPKAGPNRITPSQCQIAAIWLTPIRDGTRRSRKPTGGCCVYRAHGRRPTKGSTNESRWRRANMVHGEYYLLNRAHTPFACSLLDSDCFPSALAFRPSPDSYSHPRTSSSTNRALPA